MSDAAKSRKPTENRLDRTFLGIGNDSLPGEDLFVNRVDEMAAFRESYMAVHALNRIAPADIMSPRQNIIVFFGMGGIGKTRLSRQCELMAAGGLVPKMIPLAFRVDFDDPSFLDPETLLLAVRSAVGSLREVRTPAFDLALGAYWATKHPGEPIRSFLDRSGWLSRVTRNDRVAQDLSASIDDLLNFSSTAAASVKIGARLIAALRRRAESARLLTECPLLAEILNNEDVDDVRLFLPYLLAWDISQLEGDRQVALTIFADTFEDVQEKSSGQRDVEDVFARMVYLMPNVLFVVTGRHRLRWASAAMAEELLFYGQARWPGLVGEGSSNSQYLLGRLSPEDSESYLKARIGPPPVDDRVIRKVVEASDGWPLYLDLQATSVRRLRVRSEQIQESDFGGPLVEVVVRIMRDLDQWERALLRASSLVATVDESILKAAVPEVLESQISQFLDMSLLTSTEGRRGLNRALSDSVLEADRELSDRWSPNHWKTVANRLLTYFERVSQEDDPALLTSAYLDGFELGARFGICPQWLPLAGERLFAHGLWEILQIPQRSEHVRASGLGPVAQASTAAALRATGGTAAAASLAAQLVVSLPALEGEVHDYVAWQVVASAERSGDHEMAGRICSTIETPAFRARALVRLGRLAWIAGNLPEAIELASAAGAELANVTASDHQLGAILGTVAITGQNLMGWIRFTQGLFDEAEAHFRRALAEARRQTSEFFTVSEKSHVALTLAISARSGAAGDIESALVAAESLGSIRPLAQARIAAAMLNERGAPEEEVLTELDRIRHDLETSGDELDVRLPMLGTIIVLLNSGQLVAAQGVASELTSMLNHAGRHRCFGQIACWLVSAEAPSDAQLVWADDPDAVARRWQALIQQPGKDSQ